jgi:hypothetical protein
MSLFVPNWDPVSQRKVRDALLVLGSTMPDFKKPFGTNDQVDPCARYYEKNPYDAYTINNPTAKKSADGLIAIQFGGCDGKILNGLPISKGWNYTVRLYRPRLEILNGKWKFPEPEPES